MTTGVIRLGKDATGYLRNRWKRGEITLETVIKMIILALLLGVMLFFIYKFIVDRIGKGTIDPLVDETQGKIVGDKENPGIFDDIFKKDDAR